MKLVRKVGGAFEARFSKPDWRCFLKVINLYPCVPPAHHRLTREPLKGQGLSAAQTLLDEALAEHRQQNKKALLKTLADPARLTVTERGFILRLAAPEIMNLLQVLNDVRVGCWIHLGSPEQFTEPRTEAEEHYFYSMELAGHYEAVLMPALDPGA